MDCGIALDRKGVFDPYAAWLCHSAQIIAQEVYDHQVFGAVFLRGSEFLVQRLILLCIRAARARALHRLGFDLAIFHRNKQFRREAEQPMRPVEYSSAIPSARGRS